MFFRRKPLWLIKLLHFEYWTWWVFYLPLFPWYLRQAFRAKSLTFFTNVDPCIEYGGFFGESKIGILEKIDKNYLPKTVFIPTGNNFDFVITQLEKKKLNFPIICKPNVGERGTNVEKIENLIELKKYYATVENFIIQEFIDYKIELGILYYRFPNKEAGQITSITKKGFLEVVGNGVDSIEDLMYQSDRARFQIKTMQNRMGGKIKNIPYKNEIFELEPIGNHCRGTTFFDNNYLITKRLENIFDEISKPIIGFHYGRFDLRVRSLEDLYQGKNIKILELNGVSADPGHIYDPDYKLIRAYIDIANHWKILADISIEQQKRKIRPIALKILWPVVKAHFFN